MTKGKKIYGIDTSFSVDLLAATANGQDGALRWVDDGRKFLFPVYRSMFSFVDVDIRPD
jgi:hypothetical protein